MLEQRNRVLERQIALYASTPRPTGDVAQNTPGPSLRIPNRASPPSSFGGPASPSSTQSEPVYLKTEEQDGIDLIIAPTRHLHVRNPTFSPTHQINLTNLMPTRV